MTKVKVKFCKICGNYTTQTYLGKPEKSKDDKSFERMATFLTLGAYQLSKKLYRVDNSKLWRCSQCGHILET